MRKLLLIIGILFFQLNMSAQLKRVRIEKYYIADANDATDTIGGGIEVGSTTYRVYLELQPNTRVLNIFGSEGHPFVVSSTAPFFNNLVQGKSFGKDFTKAALSENTVALDTYLSIGQVAKQGAKVFFALPKTLDSDGSFIGGTNNDGGSNGGVGLLSAENSEAGIPLTVQDGFDTLQVPAINWTSNGVQDFITGADSTIFGSLVAGNEFRSEAFNLSASVGIGGVVPDSNFVLIGQFTTTGELSFELNAEIQVYENGQWNSITYVGRDTMLSNGEVYNPFLSYPYACGCMNPDYLEYNASYVCELEGSCQNLIVYGCADSMACNYNVEVNVNVQDLCCYPGDCNNRDLIEVCPQLLGSAFELTLFPNPVQDILQCNILNDEISDLTIKVYNANGVLLHTQNIQEAPYNFNAGINVSDYEAGLYQLVISANGKTNSKLFFKY